MVKLILFLLTILTAAAPGPGAAGEAATMRKTMVDDQIRARGISDSLVLAAMEAVPRHLFVGADWRDRAYADTPLPIGLEQTISQPYIVALMSELAELRPGEKVLEVGTGSGYQAAVLAEMGAEVWSVEILPELGRLAEANLAAAGYGGVRLRVGDGYQGWLEAAPFDAILLTAAPEAIPPPLFAQLAEGGVLVAPVGRGSQVLAQWRQSAGELTRRDVIPVRFVPMTGRAMGESR